MSRSDYYMLPSFYLDDCKFTDIGDIEFLIDSTGPSTVPGLCGFSTLLF